MAGLGAWDDEELRGPGLDLDAADDLFEFTASGQPVEEEAELEPLPPGVTDLSGDRGVLIKYKQRGSEENGKPSEECPFVELHYEGFLVDSGVRFDSTREQQYTMTVRLDIPAGSRGGSELIRGWAMALRDLRAGDLVELTVGPEYAYGETGTSDGDIPPNAALRFDIEVLDVRATHKRSLVVDTTQQDMSRLEQVRQERELAAQRRDEENLRRDEERRRKAQRLADLQAKLASKHSKKGGKKKRKK